jgi:hypothetical protein
MRDRAPHTDGERLAAAYLRQRRFPYKYEPQVRGRNIDFVAEAPSGQVALEIYEPRLRLPNRAGPFDSVAPILGLFQGRKRKQIAAAKDAGIPLILVVGSANSDMAFNLYSAESAMFGRQGVRFAVDETGQGSEPEWAFLGGGRIQPRLNTGVSALALLSRFNPTKWRLEAAWRAQGLVDRPPTETRRELAEVIGRMAEIETEATDRGVFDPSASLARLIVLHNPHAVNSLTFDFAGPHDDQYGTAVVDDGRLGWGHVASGIRRWEVAG